MNEISVIVEQTRGIVTTNFEEIKRQLYIQMDEYRGIIYTEDTIKSAKETVAMLRKVKKAINDKRKEVKKEQMLSYEEFEIKIKEMEEIIDDVINPTVEQVSIFEEKAKTERLEGIKKYFSDKSADVIGFISFNDIFIDSMLNASTSAKSIKEKFDNAIESVRKDIATIKSMKSEIETKVLDKYVEAKSLSACVNMITEHEKMKAEIIAKQEQELKVAEEKRLAEQKMRVEIEAKMREEAEAKKMQEAIEKAKEEERRKVEQEMAIQRAKEDEERRAQEEIARIEAERLAKIEAERIEAERIEAARLDKLEEERIEKGRIESERLAKIEEDKRIAAELKLAEEKKKNAKYVVKVTGLSKEQLKILTEYLKENTYHFESEVE